MFRVPDETVRRFDAAMDAAGIGMQERGYFQKWLRYYLDFCDKYRLPSVETGSRTLGVTSKHMIPLKNVIGGEKTLFPHLVIVIVLVFVIDFARISITIMRTITIRNDGGAIALDRFAAHGVFQQNHMFRRDPPAPMKPEIG